MLIMEKDENDNQIIENVEVPEGHEVDRSGSSLLNFVFKKMYELKA